MILSTFSENVLSRCHARRERALGGEAEPRALGQPGLEVDVEPQPLAQARSALAQRPEPAVRQRRRRSPRPGRRPRRWARPARAAAPRGRGRGRRRGCRTAARRADRERPPAVSRRIRSVASLVVAGIGGARARRDRGVPRPVAAVVAEADAHARLEPGDEAGRRCAARGTRRRRSAAATSRSRSPCRPPTGRRCERISRLIASSGSKPPRRSGKSADQPAARPRCAAGT